MRDYHRYPQLIKMQEIIDHVVPNPNLYICNGIPTPKASPWPHTQGWHHTQRPALLHQSWIKDAPWKRPTQFDGGIFSVDAPSLHMTPARVKLMKSQPAQSPWGIPTSEQLGSQTVSRRSAIPWDQRILSYPLRPKDSLFFSEVFNMPSRTPCQETKQLRKYREWQPNCLYLSPTQHLRNLQNLLYKL